MGHLFDKPIVPKDEQPQELQAAQPQRGTQEWARAKLAEIYKRIDTAGSNFASIGFREKLRNEVREMAWGQVGVLTIEKYVVNKIREHELGSIR
jgi:hypothetical protein